MAETPQHDGRGSAQNVTVERQAGYVDERTAFKVSVALDDRAVIAREVRPVYSPQSRVSSPSALLVRAWLAVSKAAIDEVEYGTLFLTIPIFLIAGCTLYFSLSVEPAMHQLPLAGAVIGLSTFVLRKYAAFQMALLGVFFCVAGAWFAQLHTHMKTTSMMGSAVVTTLSGTVLEVERRPAGAARYTVRIEATERPRLRYPPEIVRISSRRENPEIVPGTVLRTTAQLRAASGPSRPGGYDFAFQAFFAGYGANGFSYGTPTLIEGPENWLDGGLARLRLALADRIIKHAPDRSASAIAAALIAGKKGRIPEPVTEALRVTGLAHILAISGLHMALVAGTMMVFVRLMLSWDQGIAARRQTKKWAAIAALAVATGYLFLAGASIATQRSYIMLTVMLIALCLDRPAITKRNLAIAAIIIVVLQPNAVVTPGFQMSFAATLALIGGYDLINRRQFMRRDAEPPKRRALVALVVRCFRILLAVALTSVIAGVATGIFSAYHFHRIAALSLPANVLAMPIITFVTMPSALVSVAAIPFGLDGFAFPVMFASIDAVTAIAAYFASASPAGQVGAMSDARLGVLALALILFCVPRSWMRFLAIGVLLCAIMPFASKPTPAVRVSEDAKQVAIIVAGNGSEPPHLAVNRVRPSRFIVDQWAYADAVPKGRLIKPVKAGRSALSPQFQCINGVCVAQIDADTDYQTSIAVIEEPGSHGELCEKHTLIVEAYAPARLSCDEHEAYVVTAQQLALKGAAEIYFAPGAQNRGKLSHVGNPTMRIKHAIEGDLRPWHSHRIYGRSARNLAPYERR